MKSLRCAIYTRKSSDEGLEQEFNSLHAQRESCEAYVLSQTSEGWVALKNRYDDGGISGGTMNRPALKALLADIAAGRVDIVLVYKLDRLTRSLMDFMKMVEVFDRHQVSFVSVTQSFNTTSSMSRLTLNMLLSFAQFEREVTSERIRDKVKASKKRGMWMGGTLPLGYDVEAQMLKVNAAEADQVRHIFRRYLELRSVRALAVELAAAGYRSKLRVTKSGTQLGGQTIRRGALFHLLSNRTYIGEIPHKGESYPGQHPPIVDRELFDAVQKSFADNRIECAKPNPNQQQYPLTGKVFDIGGRAMSPSTARGKKNRAYRYYSSADMRHGEPRDPDGLYRVSAPPFEGFIQATLTRLLATKGGSPATIDALSRIDVARGELKLTLKAAIIALPGESGPLALQRLSSRLEAEERAWQHDEEEICVVTPVVLSAQRGAKALEGVTGEESAAHRVAAATLRRAHRIVRSIGLSQVSTLIGDPEENPLSDSYARRTATLAFLAPDIQRAILLGEAPAALTRLQLMKPYIPASWSEQRKLLGFAEHAR